MEWSQPWAFLGLLLLPLLAVLSVRVASYRPTRAWWTALVLRGVGVVLLVTALAQPQWRIPDTRVDWLWLVDGSPSISAESTQWMRDYLGAAQAGLAPKDRQAIVSFGETSHLLQNWDESTADEPLQFEIQGDQTDLEGGLRAALAEFAGDRRGRIVLLSDGRTTRGNAPRAATEARTRGISVSSIIPEPALQPQDVWVEDIILPPRVRLGESFEVRVLLGALSGAGPVEGTLRVRYGEYALTQPISIANQELVAIQLNASEAGLQRLEVALTSGQDEQLGNNTLHRFVSVEHGPRALLVSRSARHSQPLQDALTLQDFDVSYVAAAGLAEPLSRLGEYDVVIFDNVPAADFTSAQLEHLRSYVKDLGGGFVMLGSDHGFGSGGYRHTALEPLLPVDLAVPTPREMPYVALVAVLDRSDSMGAGVTIRGLLAQVNREFGDANAAIIEPVVPEPATTPRHQEGSKLEVAKLASISAIQMLNPTDLAGVISFNTNVVRPVPLALPGTPQQLASQLDPIAAEGGTDLYLGLEAAIEDLRQINAVKKHIIALSDGVTKFRRFDTLVKMAAAEGITLTTVYLGYWGDQMLMKRLAEWGRGRSYQTIDAKRIPRIFVKETETVTRTVLSEKAFQPIPRLPQHEILQDLDSDNLPQLKGHVITTARPGSKVVLEAEHGAPLLAVQRYGLGRVAAFTSDLSTAWAADWVGWPEYARFAAQLVRWAQRRTASDGLQARVSLANGKGQLSVEAFYPDGRFRNTAALRLQVSRPDGRLVEPAVVATRPGHYEARFAATRPGGYGLSLRVGPSDGLPMLNLGLSVPYSLELAAGPVDAQQLASVAEVTGGSLIDGATIASAAADLQRMRQGEDTRTTRSPLWPYLIAVLVLLFLVDIAHRQINRSQN